MSKIIIDLDKLVKAKKYIDYVNNKENHFIFHENFVLIKDGKEIEYNIKELDNYSISGLSLTDMLFMEIVCVETGKLLNIKKPQ